MDDAARIGQLLGRRPRQLKPQVGGDIARSVQATFDDGERVMAKFARPGQPLLRLEARMLADLRDAGLPVPATLAVADDVLVLAWVDAGTHHWDDDVQAAAGRAIACLHVSSRIDGCGYDYDSVIGDLVQPNPPTARWLDFFRDHRLLHRADAALRAGRLPVVLRHRLDTLAGRLDRWIDPDTTPCLLHGDLWGGNMLPTADGGACFIDPAIYRGDAGMDLAMTTLFHSVGPAFFAGYRDVAPIDPACLEACLPLYQLYPLLVHVQLFGDGHVGAVERILDRLGC